jgi:hypothetical protein
MFSKTPRLPPYQLKQRPSNEPEHENPPHSRQENVKNDNPTGGVDECDCESEEDPPDDVVSYAGGKDDHADVVLEEVFVG